MVSETQLNQPGFAAAPRQAAARPKANGQPPPAPEPDPPKQPEPAPDELTGDAPKTALWPLTYHLRRTVIAHGDPVQKFVLREPTVMDIERHGMPVELKWLPEGGYTARPVTAPMINLLADLAVVPTGAIRNLPVAQYHGLAQIVATFFMPDWGEDRAPTTES